ncbi:MAG: thiol-disulfide oxidoreductase DCC family protein [Bacteroidota bacterium]
MSDEKVIIFDGVCNFCNFWVDFLIRRDPKNKFRFTANQQKAGKAILLQYGESVEEVGTVYFYEEGQLYKESTAALRIARHLPGAWPLFYGFIIIPRPIRDLMYGWIAKNRYRFFGKKESCRLPSPEERAKFLE